MKLATFEVKTSVGRLQRLGLVMPNPVSSEPLVVDMKAAYAWILSVEESPACAQRWADFLFSDMRTFLELGDSAMVAARRVQECFASVILTEAESQQGINDERLVYRMEDISLKTPVPNPRTMRDFLAFETHVQNGWKLRNEPVPESWYKMPVYYKGNPTTLIGHDEPALWPHYSRRLDYELELACVIGKEGKNIPAEEAKQHIAGFTIMNDFSARDIQKHEMACRLGPAKGKDFCTAVGPWLVTLDEIPDIRNLRMMARINGELWSDGNSGTSHWTFEQMIAHVSMEETLYPGDILGSGTVGFGCGLELDKWLKPDDVVELEIEGLGILRNRVAQSAVVTTV